MEKTSSIEQADALLLRQAKDADEKDQLITTLLSERVRAQSAHQLLIATMDEKLAALGYNKRGRKTNGTAEAS